MRTDALPARRDARSVVPSRIANDLDVLIRRAAVDRLEDIRALAQRFRESAQQF